METMNETQSAIEVKVKRNYTKFDSDASELLKLAKAKGFNVKDIAIKFDCSNATAKKLLVNPMLCTGYDRKKFAEIFELSAIQINELIDLG